MRATSELRHGQSDVDTIDGLRMKADFGTRTGSSYQLKLASAARSSEPVPCIERRSRHQASVCGR